MTNQVATTGGNDASAAFQRELDNYTPNLAQALPGHVSVEKFKRVLVTAVGMNPELYYANRRTFFTAAVRCAADGLLPDGREAALVTYRTKTKQRDPQTGVDREVWIDAVTYMPMVAGIRKRMRNSGDVLSATAEVVYSRDQFKYRLGDDAMIEHEPPSLGEDRGEPVGAYAIIKLRSGEVLRDVMPIAEIEAARKQGRATNSLMWTKFWSEGAKKTVLRRCAKAAPQSAELDALLSREEEPPLLPDHHGGDGLPALPRAPQREDFSGEIEPVDVEFEVYDTEGTARLFRHGPSAVAALCEILNAAARLGRDRLQGVWGDNQDSLAELERHGFDVTEPVELYAELDRPASPSPSAEARPQQTVQPAPGPTAAGDGGGRRVPRGAPPTQAGAEPAMSQGDMAASDEPMGRDGQSSSAGPGPTAPTNASLFEEPPAAEEDAFGLPPLARQSQALDMVMTAGQPNYATWVRARLIPRMRRQHTSNDLAFFFGDNEENIEQASRYPDLAREIDEARTEQWRVVGELESGR